MLLPLLLLHVRVHVHLCMHRNCLLFCKQAIAHCDHLRRSDAVTQHGMWTKPLTLHVTSDLPLLLLLLLLQLLPAPASRANGSTQSPALRCVTGEQQPAHLVSTVPTHQ
jgi:hypothetical protein